MAIRQRKNKWIVYYRDPETGKQKEEHFGYGPGAEQAAVSRNDELGFGLKAHRKQSDGPTFSECLQAYAKARQWSDNSENHFTIRSGNYLPRIGQKPAVKLTDFDLNRYVDARRKDPVYDCHRKTILRVGVKWSTIAREITDIKAVLNWAAGCNPPLIPFNPIRDYKKPKTDDAIIDPPTLAEVRRILAKANPHMIRVVKLSFYLGLRPGAVELLSLTWDRVNFEARTIHVISANKGGPTSRLVPIFKGFYAELKEWYLQDGQQGPIIHYNGHPVKKIWKAWKGSLKRAGITRRIRPYDLRHHFASHLLGQGEDIKTVAEIMGSRPETILRYYRHVTRQQHRTAVDRLPDLGKNHTSGMVCMVKKK